MSDHVPAEHTHQPYPRCATVMVRVEANKIAGLSDKCRASSFWEGRLP
jgi:hypothetical protein